MSYEEFVYDRDARGRPAEYLTVAYFLARGIEASVNEAPEEDLEGRRSHDIVVAGELWDVKTDYFSGYTKRIFVERFSLEHTESYRWAYLITTPYGFDVRVFTVPQLAAMYNETIEVQRLDRTTYQLFKYKRENRGQQKYNEGIYIPLEDVKQYALAPWEIAQQLTKQAA